VWSVIFPHRLITRLAGCSTTKKAGLPISATRLSPFFTEYKSPDRGDPWLSVPASRQFWLFSVFSKKINKAKKVQMQHKNLLPTISIDY
jgi:hypothetical protein